MSGSRILASQNPKSRPYNSVNLSSYFCQFMHQLQDKALSLLLVCLSVENNSYLGCEQSYCDKDDIMKLYNGVNKRDEWGRFTCVHTFKNYEKSRYMLMDMG